MKWATALCGKIAALIALVLSPASTPGAHLHLAGSEIGGSQKEQYMKDQVLLERITLNPKVMAGKPIIKAIV